MLSKSFYADIKITHKVGLEIEINGKTEGEILLGLFGDEAPQTVENYLALCTGEKGYDDNDIKLDYKGTPMDKAIAERGVMFGNLDNMKYNGTNIYGKPMKHET